MERIAILASGKGTNAVNILGHFKETETAQIAGVFSNKMRSYALQCFIDSGSDAYYFSSHENLADLLVKNKVTFIVLAGYTKLLPAELLEEYKGKVLNIHPSLLPKHGGKGMYGMKVHEAVVKAGDKQTGITIHEVDEKYDNGKVIFQEKVKISKEDSAEDVAKKVKELELKHYPEVIEKFIAGEL